MSTHPSNSLSFFAAFNLNNAFRTTDGLTWTASSPAFGVTPNGDPVTAYDSLGNLYYETMYGGITGCKAIRSTDNGATWTSSVTTIAGVDKNWIACDQTAGPYANYVYTTMTASNTSWNFARSTNFGTTWTTTFSPTTSSQTLPGMMVAVGPNVSGGNNVSGGCVYAVTHSGTNGAGTYTFYVSTNGGSTFAQKSSNQFSNYIGTEINMRSTVQGMRCRPYPMIAADNSFGQYRGRLYLVYASNNPSGNGNKSDIFLRYSTDQGANWSSARVVNDDTDSQNNFQFHPAIWCDKETGRLYISFYDTRRVPTSDSMDVYATYTDDGGETFAMNQRLTNTTFKINFTDETGPTYRGDYNAITSNRNSSGAVWTDFRNNNYLGMFSYFPDFAMRVSPIAITLVGTDHITVQVEIPAVKLYTQTATFSATVQAGSNIAVSFPMGNTLGGSPGSLPMRIATTNTPLGQYAVTVTGQGPNGTPVHRRTIAVTIVPSVQVDVDQKRSTGDRLTNTIVGRWNDITTTFDDLHITQEAASIDARPGGREVVRGMQGIVSGPEKYRIWERNQAAQLDTIQNHRGFSVDLLLTELIARFNPTDPTVIIKTDLIDAPGTTGGFVGLRDPWLIDFADPDYGNNMRNRGMIEAIWHDTLPSPFNPNTNATGSGAQYKGVFLNENPNWLPDRPNYSVGAPSPQTIGNFTSYFQNWTGSQVAFQNSNSAQSGVVFQSSNAVATALYKAHFQSNSADALSPGTQRKILRDAAGVYYAVYASANDIWYTKSVTGGATWTPEKRISEDGIFVGSMDRNPTLTFTFNPFRILVVWEALYEDPYHAEVHILARSIDPLTYQMDQYITWLGFMPTEPPMPFAATPVAAVSYNINPPQYVLVAWNDATIPGIRGRVFDDNNHTWSGETTIRQGPVSSFSLAPNANSYHQPWELVWTEGTGYTLYYAPIAVATNPVLGTVETVSSGGGAISEPSIVNVGPQPGVAWIDNGVSNPTRPMAAGGGTTSPVTVRYRERSSTGWNTPVTIWADVYGGVSSPNVTYNWSSGTLSVFWRGGSSIRHAQRSGSVWSAAGTVVAGVTPMVSVAMPGSASGTNEVLLSRGTDSPVYNIARTAISYGPVGEGPMAINEDSSATQGRGGEIFFPEGSMHLAITGASVNGAPLRYGALNDTVSMLRRLTLEAATMSLPFPGRGTLDIDLAYRGAGSLPPDSRIRLVLRDAENGEILQNLHSFSGTGDTSFTISTDLNGGGRSVSLALTAENIGTAVRFKAERWFVPEGDDREEPASGILSKSSSESNVIPSAFALHQNYPNPFNPLTQISFDLPKDAEVILKVYDMLGKEVTTLVQGQRVAGYHTATFDASGLASGVYLYRITAGSFADVKKLVVVK